MSHQYQPLSVRNEIDRSIKSQERMLSNSLASGRLKNREKVQKDIAKNKEMLERITPPDLNGDQMKRAIARRDALADAYQQGRDGLVPPNPSEQDMQNPSTGIVGEFTRHANFWKKNTLDNQGNIVKAERGKGLANELKDLQRTINKDSEDDDPDAASLERFRNRTRRVPLADSVVPQSYGLSSQAKANYDEVFPDHVPTPVEQKIETPARPERHVHGNTKKLIPEDRRCQAIKKNGKMCGARTTIGSDRCVFHPHEAVVAAPEPQGE